MSQKKIELKSLISTSTGIFCHLLTINETKIVINCGLGIDFNYSIYDSIKQTIEEADCILLTSFDLCCMGAIGLFENSVIYCSIPTAILGKIILDELHHYLGNMVLTSFIPRQVKYSQPFKINSLDIISYNAGYVIGNSAFKISDESESISICFNFNHRKENFLDGFTASGIENTDIFVTNSSYVQVPPHTVRSRDENIHQAISNTSGTVIISVTYTRFFEVLACLNNHKITLVSKNSKMLVERVKSMVEWAGSKSAEIIPALDVEYCKISELKSQRIIVVVDDFENDGYLGSVLDRFNNENNTFISIAPKKVDFEKLKIYQYSYKKNVIVEEIEEVEEDTEESDEIEKYHWSKEKSTLFISDFLDIKDYFPFVKRRRHNNEYGEKVNFQFAKKIEEVELKPSKFIANEEIEDMKLIKTGINPFIKVKSIEYYGISDFSSSKTVLEGLNAKKIVFTNDFNENALFLSSCIAFNRQGTKSYVCNNEILFNAASGTQKVTVSEKAMEMKLKRLRDKNIANFRANRNENFVDCVGESTPIVIGNINTEVIKKSLIELGFQVEEIGEKLVVNDTLDLEFKESSLAMHSSDNGLLLSVREILYKYICII